ncbi:MAG: PAS domain S-box protein, partial [Methanomassiliicoccales archaeon]|nr:PAS domain S-box protein [Methanomassiliicoccales archaeon]
MKKRRKAERGRAGKRKGVQTRSAATTPKAKALQESEADFRSLVESAAVPICISDLTGDLTYVNKALADLGGYTVQELVGHPFMDFVHPEDREVALGIFTEAVSTSEEVLEIKFRVKRRDGKILTLACKPTRIEIDGKTVGFQAIITDITERERMERELRQSEERYRLIAENMTETIWLMDMNLKPTYISPSAVSLRGYTLEELYALPLERQLTPDSLKLAWETFKEALSEENLNSKDAPTSVTLQLEFYRKDGSTFWNESTFSLVRNSKGEPAGILGVGRDITERKRMEQVLRDSEERYRELADSITDVFFAMDKDLRYTYWNEASEDLTGISAKDAIGKSLYELFPDVKGTRAEEVYLEVLRTGQPRSFVNEYKVHGKQFTFEINAYPTKWGISVFTRDITERKRAEQALRENEEKYRKLFEEAMDGIAVADPDTGILLDCNQALAALVGRNRAQLIGQHQAILHPPSGDNGELSPTFKLHLTTHEGQMLETQVITGTGQIKEVEIKASLLHLQGRRI